MKSVSSVPEFPITAQFSRDGWEEPLSQPKIAVFHSYSARSAIIGFTRVARRAGTKQDAAATAVSNAATVV